ncbi:Zn-dependent protease/predicted transcriptional regulator [Saonia flava]|uniref:Zinc metalloprotease n=1 Tax=Saonia flava TaxID=523696 RepID=A0A846R498_9FLAO|nr:site-2 protease family protein [Saonia flava]NJB72184.1 Zn-dependent protease/predicted transcriptional regulator [Saonia flava]
MKGVLKLGRILGTSIEVHWTFSLLLLWIAYLDFQRGGNLNSTLISIAFVLVLFLCVVLHELGHAQMAKRFKINTKKITLLPIGGVATMEKIPEKPKQELLVAIAGPAVNVVIVLLLSLVVPFRTYFSLDIANLETLLRTSTLEVFLFYLLMANVMLVIFNLIPAFPMDGGRVLRALLSFKMDRVNATSIAAGLGQFLAILFFILGFIFNPFLILIALFIFIGAQSEYQMVKQNALLKGFKAKEAMLTKISLLKPNDTMSEVVKLVLDSTEKDFVVVDNENIVGVVLNKDIIKYSDKPSMTVKDVMQTTFKTVDASEEINKIFGLFGNERNGFFPVLENKKLVGAIDLTNISEFIVFKSKIIQT